MIGAAASATFTLCQLPQPASDSLWTPASLPHLTTHRQGALRAAARFHPIDGSSSAGCTAARSVGRDAGEPAVYGRANEATSCLGQDDTEAAAPHHFLGWDRIGGAGMGKGCAGSQDTASAVGLAGDATLTRVLH